ncbi:MAG: MFS transporter [Sphingomonas sp.]|nr:MFS transporter [Sphingomonas sp.]
MEPIRSAKGDEALSTAAADDSGVTKTAGGQRTALVIAASSLGTVFEWYDFYLYGLLATILSAQFFSSVNETTGFILALAAFAAGFAVRPLGAILFGRIGDLVGRKNTFLVTMAIMGLSTFLVGLLPSYASIGIAAPLLLVALRLLQGLALGGEYGGAATYVAEHAPQGRRGLHTSFIQTTATLGLFAALIVVITTRTLMGEEAFAAWGWRLPFLISLALLAVSMWIRLQLEESPVFRQMKAEGTTSRAPLTEAFAKWPNLKLVLVALFGAVAGQAVVWYTGQFYALFFLEKSLRVDGATANIMIAIALAIGTPFFLFFGWLSDRIGRKKIILTGCLIAALTYFPLFDALSKAVNPALHAAQADAPITVHADPGTCSVQFDPIGKTKFDKTGCDVARSTLAKAGIPYASEPHGEGEVSIGGRTVEVGDLASYGKRLSAAVSEAAYPEKANPAQINRPLAIAILTLLVIYVTMVYGPIAALLVELFPARIRYTSMSLPYHIGNGWFGGFLPTISFAIVAATGNIYSGLWYPVIVAAATVIIGALLLPETRGNRIDG